jgi:uncharacterized protein YyaL (SSP411 family)
MPQHRSAPGSALPEPVTTDELGVARWPVEDLSREELQSEVRRLRLRLDALRRQRDERISDSLDLEQQLALAVEQGFVSALAVVPVSEWRRRAEASEAAHAALMATRTMRLLHRPRQVYGRLRSARAGQRAGG